MIFGKVSGSVWQARAFSNIALIKYMGKKEGGNIAVNPSLSFTSKAFFSEVELKISSKDTFINSVLCSKEQERFLKHLRYIKDHFSFSGGFEVESKNSFPSSCGIASSASSFAALTLCASSAIAEITGKKPPGAHVLAELSRAGSGSSCRSFYAPWALWDAHGVKEVALPELQHFVVVVSDEKKEVSSSIAHARVVSSMLFDGRVQRAEQRLQALLAAFENNSWKEAFNIVWAEFWDMHALFETSMPSFSYFKPSSLEVLGYVRDFWNNHGNGPLVTADAGPNIHLLFRGGDDKVREKLLGELRKNYMILG